MTRTEATQKMAEGKQVRRASWPNRSRTVYVHGNEIWEKANLTPAERHVSTLEDELATDWEVVS
jgi:hypothetical protein